MLRHGDFYVLPLAEAEAIFNRKFDNDPTATPLERDEQGVIFGLGEVTGHKHIVEGTEEMVTATRHGDFVKLTVNHPTFIKHTGYEGHRDHKDLPIEAGTYIILGQREYQPVLESKSRPVVD